MVRNFLIAGALTAGMFAGSMGVGQAASAQNFLNVTIKTEHVSGNIHVLYGAGGNIGVSVGDDGIYLIDDQYAQLTNRIKEALAELSDQPVRYVINTHFHGDHTGGNENLANEGSLIIAHDNVRQRLSKGAFIKAFNAKMDPQVAKALPVITFDSELSLHLNGEEARAIHISHAHTDGDSIVHFKSSNVIHMGDTFFANRLPFIDVDDGGHVDGVIKAVDAALAIADDNTKIIPGHGRVTDKAGLEAYGKIVREARTRIKAEFDKGTSLEALQASNILEGVSEFPHNDDWAKKFIGFVYNSFAK